MRSGFEEFSDAEQAWREAIAALYEMTCEDRPDGPVEGCTCCVSTALAHELASIDRETAPRALMYDFAARALLTLGIGTRFPVVRPAHPGTARGRSAGADRRRNHRVAAADGRSV